MKSRAVVIAASLVLAASVPASAQTYTQVFPHPGSAQWFDHTGSYRLTYAAFSGRWIEDWIAGGRKWLFAPHARNHFLQQGCNNLDCRIPPPLWAPEDAHVCVQCTRSGMTNFTHYNRITWYINGIAKTSATAACTHAAGNAVRRTSKFKFAQTEWAESMRMVLRVSSLDAQRTVKTYVEIILK